MSLQDGETDSASRRSSQAMDMNKMSTLLELAADVASAPDLSPAMAHLAAIPEAAAADEKAADGAEGREAALAQSAPVGATTEPPALAASAKSSATSLTASQSSPVSTGAGILHERHLANGQLAIWVGRNDVRLCNSKVRAVSLQSALSLALPITRGYSGLRRGTEDVHGSHNDEQCRCGRVSKLLLVTHGIGQANERTVRPLGIEIYGNVPLMASFAHRRKPMPMW